MKIIRIDNYDRQTVADKIAASGIENNNEAVVMLTALQNDPNRSPDVWFRLVDDDYVLWRGMEDLV
jgi:hypothetical protein